ncbi:A-kinase anchor protein 9-like isoform X3 [Anopheles albimanus]|uniref:A-kinase anchor protein 9-like isoform X3 n=1 Tax=Anopheles albimanus TaxID=7167 RepID=UPI00163E1962|nr:A-kinase anchor protein 9-like isoform X3 [Anopheles albimanus]
MNSNTSKMNGNQKNESFKLLQLSEDSKSLSDLELPEVLSQRKRKVRRKTRARTSSYRGDEESGSGMTARGNQIDCRNFSIWLAVAMTVLWLFIISYVTSVIHGENRRLELALQKVSATSQNVPEALQKWHETSKNLEQNQTALNGKLRDMQQRLTSFHEDLKQFREALEKKNENSQEAQFNRLTASVADLGSNIAESKSRITVLETQISTVQDDQKQLNKTLADIQNLFGRLQNSSAGSGIIGGSGAQDLEKMIVDLRDQLSGRLDKLAENVTGELQTLRQKNIWLVADLANHTKRIEQLIDNTANISSEVSSIESVWLDIRNNMSGLEADRKTINDQLAALANVTTGLHGTIAKVQEECQQYHNKLDGVNGKLGALQDQIQQLQESKQAMHRPPIVPEQEPQRLVNATHQENMPAALSKIFEDQPPIPEAERLPVAIKPSDTPSITTEVPVYPFTGTPVMQPGSTSKPTGTTEAKAAEVASGGSAVSKKASATFDSAM